MAKTLAITVKESIEELQKYLRKSSCETIKKRAMWTKVMLPKVVIHWI
jgi:hypothetical protein